jgi:hypothetical protein
MRRVKREKEGGPGTLMEQQATQPKNLYSLMDRQDALIAGL